MPNVLKSAVPNDTKLYKKIKEQVYEDNPKHSAYRSMAVVKKYKKAGGTYSESDNKAMNTKTGGCASCGMSGGLKSLVAREGGKVLLKKRIVDEYFPEADTYSTYVEPFVGGGSIYFYKNKDNHKEIINDIDYEMIDLFKGFKNYEGKKIADDVNGNYTEKDFENIKKSNPTSEYKKFLKNYLLYKLSYLGRGASFGKPRISATFKGYKDRLDDATILNTDYKNVIKNYDSKATFFYLDPPVTKATGPYNYPAINLPELSKVVKGIKGKFLLSLGTTKYDKELFKGFKTVTISTKYVGERTKGGQSYEVEEHLIMNYEPKLKGGCMSCGRSEKKKTCGGCAGMCGGIVPQFHSQLKKIDLNPKKYLSKAKELASASGYDPSKIDFSDDAKHKLMYHSPDGDRYFGAVTYSDYIIWTWLEHTGEADEGEADKRRKAYRARATKIKGNWKADKYSPNNLAINILW
jgi:DNA adenine methylase